MARALLTAMAAVLWLVPLSAQAAKVNVWHHHLPAHYDKAQLKHAVVSSNNDSRRFIGLPPSYRDTFALENLPAVHDIIIRYTMGRAPRSPPPTRAASAPGR